MARIEYDVYLSNSDAMVVISNAYNDDAMDITPESLSNPPIKMRILDVKYDKDIASGKYSDFFRADSEHRGNEIFTTNLPRLLNGEIPNWRLTGVNFAIEGMDLFIINTDTNLSLADPETVRNGYECENMICLGFDYLLLEFTVDYTDDSPSRRYIAELRYEGDSPIGEFKAKITEYIGKRKIRKIEFSEYKFETNSVHGHPCHITEY